jgi:hypothetical protein
MRVLLVDVLHFGDHVLQSIVRYFQSGFESANCKHAKPDNDNPGQCQTSVIKSVTP